MSVLLCRGCCCGSGKHPDVDHEGQEACLRAALPGPSVRLWVVDCLGTCERSNVVVVRSGGTRTWFGGVLAADDTQALADWVSARAVGPLPARLAGLRFKPDRSSPIAVRRLSLSPEGIADLAWALLQAGVGSWSMGRHGALAKFEVDGDRPELSRCDRTLESLTPRGGVRLRIAHDTTAFVVDREGAGGDLLAVILAAPPHGGAPVGTVTGLGPDRDSLRPEDRDRSLVDLGVGLAGTSFAVRASDPALVGILDCIGGLGWRDALDLAGPELVRRSPHRVVTSPLGRVEVFSPTPPPGDTSPAGPLTYLLPSILELGRQLPPGIRLPRSLTVGAVFHPPRA